jgi:hypothetical protein
MPGAGSLFIGFAAGVFGVAYFVYGKRQVKFMPMLAGVALCVYPYFIDSVPWSIAIGLALLAAPFLIDY